MLCGLLRFVPYIGPIIAAFFRSRSRSPSIPAGRPSSWPAALFIVVELISNNAVEPWLYGSSTGLSPVASSPPRSSGPGYGGRSDCCSSTPLTVCLVVLGRHVPQLAFLDVLFGNEPALAPPELLYQRLLVGDPERADRARRGISADPRCSSPITTRWRSRRWRSPSWTVPTGALLTSSVRVLPTSAIVLVDNLAEWEAGGQAADEEERIQAEAQGVDLSVLRGAQIICAGARGDLDDAAAAMLAQLLEREGASVRLLAHHALQSTGLRDLDIGEPDVVVISYMNADSLAHARFSVRRLRRRLPTARIIVGLWTFQPEAAARRDPLEASRADGVATSLEEALRAVAERLSQERSDATEATQHRSAALRVLPQP